MARHNRIDTNMGGAVAREGEDAKLEALRAERSLNPRPAAVSDEAFREREFLDARDLVQVKYEMLRRVRLEGEPVSRAARAFGFSRPSFYQAQAALAAGGLAALVPARPGPRGAHKLSADVIAFVHERLERQPSLRSPQLAELIEQRFGVRVHPRSVERALARAARPKSGGEQ
jgi:transposase